MAELTPIPSAQRPAEPGYQPISGYAVAAAIVAGAFVALLIPIMVIAITSRRTALSTELLILPAIGIVLAAIARSNVRNSEGTRTGLKLATISWWACILGGVGFGAYLYANQMILERESGRFADKFMDEIKSGRTRHAFLYLVPPDERRRADPDDADAFETAYAQLGYATYKNTDFVRLTARNKDAIEVERLGVKDLGQENNGFKSTVAYRVKCPEGAFECQVRLVAMETRKGGAPQWRIPGQPAPSITMKTERLSQYGSLMTELEQKGDEFARMWIASLSDGRTVVAHTLTVPADERKLAEDAVTGLVFLGGPTAAVMPLSPTVLPANRGVSWRQQLHTALLGGGTALRFPLEHIAFEELAEIGFFHLDAAGNPHPEDKRSRLRELWRVPYMMHSADRPPNSTVQPADRTQMTVTPERILVVVPADLLYDGRSFVRCFIGVECTNPAVLSAFAAARATGGQAPNDGHLSLRSLPAQGWRIVWLRTDMEPQAVQGTTPGGRPS